MARRFIVKNEDINVLENNNINIRGPEVKHIQVLRHNVEDSIIVNENIYKIVSIGKDNIDLEYIKKAPQIGIPTSNITLYIGFLKSEKMDFLVQKSVEIGVKRIVPFFSKNVVVKLDEKAREKRREKLQKIADEACKQCGRMDTVKVEEFLDFKKLKSALNEEKVFFAYEASKDSLRNEIINLKERKLNRIGIVIGAEGGFDAKEAEELNKLENVCCVSLGDRILRAETAALNLLSILIYEMEE